MFYFYYSEDQGLLNSKIEEFKTAFKDIEEIKNCNISQLANALLQTTIFNTSGNFVIENFDGQLKDLQELITSLDLKKINILTTYKCPESTKIPKLIKDFSNNKDLLLKKLNAKTKHMYFKNLIKTKKIKIDINEADLTKICEKLPKSADEINGLLDSLLLYSFTNKITKETIEELIKSCYKEINYFDFFNNYFSNNSNLWIQTINENINSPQDLVLFMKMFCYKLFEFSNFTNLKKKHNIEEISKITKKPTFIFFEYEKIYLKHQKYIEKYLRVFTINLYFFIFDNFFKKEDINNFLIHFFFSWSIKKNENNLRTIY